MPIELFLTVTLAMTKELLLIVALTVIVAYKKRAIQQASGNIDYEKFAADSEVPAACLHPVDYGRILRVAEPTYVPMAACRNMKGASHQ